MTVLFVIGALTSSLLIMFFFTCEAKGEVEEQSI